jgi:hypothetical protein
MFSRPLRIPEADAQRLGRAVLPLAVSLAGFGIFGLAARYQRSALLCFLCLGTFIPLSANLGMGVTDVIFEAKSGRQIARQLSVVPPGTELACLECFPNGVPFYLGRMITLISRDGDELKSNYIIYALAKDPQWPKQIVPLADFDHWLTSRKTPVYLMVRQVDRGKLESITAACGATIQSIASGYFGALLPPPEGG